MSKVSYSPKAKQDLQDIKEYYAQDLKNTQASVKVLKAITERIRTLEDFPKSGRKLSAVIDIETDYRFIGCSGYLAFYRIADGNVFVVRIIHGRRDYIAALFGRAELGV